MKISKTKLKTIGKKIARRSIGSSQPAELARFLDAYDRGFILTKDGREVTHEQWADEQPEPLRSMLKELLVQEPNEPGKDLSG